MSALDALIEAREVIAAGRCDNYGIVTALYYAYLDKNVDLQEMTDAHIMIRQAGHQPAPKVGPEVNFMFACFLIELARDLEMTKIESVEATY